MPPFDIDLNPTLLVQQRVQVSGDRMILNLRTLVDPYSFSLPSTIPRDESLNLRKKFPGVFHNEWLMVD